MNMKKTMAAIAAGAVAVSAMATTVSAEDAASKWANKTVTFNLVETKTVLNGYKATFTATIANIDLSGTGDLTISIDGLSQGANHYTNKDKVKVTGAYVNTTKPIVDMYFTNNTDDPQYSPVGAGMITRAASNAAAGTITIPVQADAAGKAYTLDDQGLANLVIVVEKYFTTADGITSITDLRTALTTPTYNFSVAGATAGSWVSNYLATGSMPTTVDSFEKDETTKNYPYKSYENAPIFAAAPTYAGNGNFHEGDVLDCIYRSNAKDTKLDKAYAVGIINDAINSYGNVTFTFNTYKSKVDVDVADWEQTKFNKNWWDLEDTNVNGLFDETNYWLNNWEDMTLFGSALVVNSSITMSLSDSQAMKWTRDALTFDWDDIQAAALNPNAYTSFIQTMALRTGKVWYWDNLQVTFEEGVAEEVTAGAGDEADDNQIVEDPEDDGFEDDDDWGDDDEDDDWGDDEDDDDGEDDGEEDGGEVDNSTDVQSPKTGNPAVALAVIPVALAAAAVVAKKRG